MGSPVDLRTTEQSLNPVVPLRLQSLILGISVGVDAHESLHPKLNCVGLKVTTGIKCSPAFSKQYNRDITTSQ